MFVRTFCITDTKHKDVRTTDVDAKALNISRVVQNRGTVCRWHLNGDTRRLLHAVERSRVSTEKRLCLVNVIVPCLIEIHIISYTQALTAKGVGLFREGIDVYFSLNICCL
jgi:hypothetical protein